MIAFTFKVGSQRESSSGLLVACFICLTAIGCGASEGGTHLQGVVSYKGAPVTSGVINFVKAGSRPLGGALKSDGAYAFDMPPGEYQVLINAPAPLPAGWKEGDPLPKAPPLAPEKFASFGTSGLTVSVGQDSPQKHDFVLQ